MSEILVEARGIGKSYPLVFRRRDRVRALRRLLFTRRSPDVSPVLQDVDLTVYRGQSLGLIGENGAGKSTLLKLIAGVLTPSQGEVQVSGRIGALLELGAGFHPEYTGRENIVTAAALYGLTDAELADKLPEIIAFADIGRYIDEPIKHYSSGMVVRLGFAIVVSVRPDLLITDEVLAVGDESFQKKCVRWMEEYLDKGGTLILVSHSMYHIQKLCRRALWLREGKVQASGEAADVCQAYLAYHERKSAREAGPQEKATDKAGLEFQLLDLALNGATASGACTLHRGDALHALVRMSSRDGRTPHVHLSVVRADGTPVFGINSDMDGMQPVNSGVGEFSIGLLLPGLPLLPGSYTVRAHVLDTEGLRLFDTLENHFTVMGQGRELGLVALEHVWQPAMPTTAPLRHEEPTA